MRIVAIALFLPLALPLVACGGHTPAATDPAASTSNPPSDVAASPPSSDALDASSSGASAPAPIASSSDAKPDAAVTASHDDAGAPPVDSAPVNSGPTFDMSVVESVLKEHKDALKKVCWDKSKSDDKAYIGTVTIRLAPTGKVMSAQTDGTDALASKCIDKQVKGWKFPAPKGTASIKMPIRLRRD